MKNYERQLVRYSIAFIILVPVVMAMWDYPKHRDEVYSESVRRASRIETRREKEWESGIDCFADCDKTAKLRQWLLRSSKSEQLSILMLLHVDTMRALATHLELRPYKYEHDVKCIRLLGVVKNYLQLLDNAGAERIIDLYPEQQIREDKSC